MKRRYSYKDLHRMVFGDGESVTGLLRERDFTLEVLSGWRSHADFLAELMKQDRAAIQRVRDLHKRIDEKTWWHAPDCVGRDQWHWRQTWQCKPECQWKTIASCNGCPYEQDYGKQPYPCDTIKALDGDLVSDEYEPAHDVASQTPNVTPNVMLDGEQG